MSDVKEKNKEESLNSFWKKGELKVSKENKPYIFGGSIDLNFISEQFGSDYLSWRVVSTARDGYQTPTNFVFSPSSEKWYRHYDQVENGVVFLKGWPKVSSAGNNYINGVTFKVSEIIEQLGTNCVLIKLSIKNDEVKTLVMTPSEIKWVRKEERSKNQNIEKQECSIDYESELQNKTYNNDNQDDDIIR